MNKRFLSLCLVIAVVLSILSAATVTPIAETTPTATQVTYDSSYALYDYSDFDFSALGENLIKDPTVACFESDGVTYKSYYTADSTASKQTVLNADACWGKAPNTYHHFMNLATMWYSPAKRGFVSSNTSYSHSADGSGAIVLKDKAGEITNKVIPLPAMEAESYYLITAWYKMPDGKSNELKFLNGTNEMALTCRFDNFGNNDWVRFTVIYYTGSSKMSYPNLQYYNTTVCYIDDIGVYKLDNNYGKECVKNGKLVYETDAKDKVSRGFAPYGYGDRRYYSAKSCDDANNLIGNPACDDSSYWADLSGLLSVSSAEAYEGSTSIKFSGNGTYRKTVSGLKANTYYYLSLYGKAYTNDVVTDINFGMMSPGGYPFENPMGWELGEWTREVSSKQEITIFCPDGTWYNRTYRFYTGEYTELDFFITGTKGKMYLDSIRLFEEANAKSANPAAQVENITVTSINETNFACNSEKNLIPNGDFENGSEYWENFNGFGKFVEVVTSSGNKMLHYKYSKAGYYYMAKVDIEAQTEYTFSYWTLNLNGDGAKFGLVGIMPLKNNEDMSPFEYVSNVRNVSDDYGEWKLVSVRFTPDTDTTVAFAIFDGGGEAIFDNVRLFKSADGYELAAADDKPTGGELFVGSVLGSDGMQVELPDDALFTQVTHKGSTIYDYSGINFDCYGENLITDPTVSAFDASGNYKSYYQLDENGAAVLNENTGKKIILNEDAWWDKPADDYQVFVKKSSPWFTMKTKGYTVKSVSHTNDGSGSINITETQKQNYLALPKMQKKSYYLVSLWVKFAKKSAFLFGDTTSDNAIAFMYKSDLPEAESTIVNYQIYKYSGSASSGDWEQITFLVYTGEKEYSPKLRIYNNFAGYVDDISVYKLNPYYGRLSIEEGKLLTPDYENLGDVNNDGTVDTKDLVRLKKVLAGVTDQYSIMNIDVSYDGYVSSIDLVTLRKYLIGNIKVFK